jgi:hypothetical protein
MKQRIHLTEHLLLPLVLACLNIGGVHLLYLFAAGAPAPDETKILVALSLVFLVAGIIYKRKWLLLGAPVFYLAVLLGAWWI